MIVWLKTVQGPRVDKEMLRVANEGRSILGRPLGGESRGTFTSDATDTERQGLEAQLAPFGVDVNHGRALPYISLRIPNEAVEAVVEALFKSPLVDWLEVNVPRPRVADAGPLGSNPTDFYHTFHYVTGAWDHTRGAGAKIGVMDSGLGVTSTPGGSKHEDLTHVIALGFVDDLSCTGGGQSAGECTFWDDNGHGTAMAGVAFGADNSLPSDDRLGMAPQSTAYSMKVAFNTNIPLAGTCSSVPFWEQDFCIESDDHVAAFDYAIAEGIDILSMSYSGDFGTSEFIASVEAYNSGILLISSIGNFPYQSNEPQEFGHVMGVGAVWSDLQLAYTAHTEYYEVGAYASAWSTEADCPNSTSYCTLLGYSSTGATSGATAMVAGMAALILSEDPSLTGAQVRQRLIDSASGRIYKVADAEWAVENKAAVGAPLSGPSSIQSTGYYSWSVAPSGGTGSYTYVWEKKTPGTSWQTVGFGTSYGFTVGQQQGDFEVRVTVTSAGRKEWNNRYVTVNLNCDPEVDPGCHA